MIRLEKITDFAFLVGSSTMLSGIALTCCSALFETPLFFAICFRMFLLCGFILFVFILRRGLSQIVNLIEEDKKRHNLVLAELDADDLVSPLDPQLVLLQKEIRQTAYFVSNLTSENRTEFNRCLAEYSKNL